MQNKTTTTTVHLFERQGFGPGPYRLVAHNPSCTVQTLAREAGVDLGLWPGPDQAAGTCDSCGQGIKEVFTLRSSTGTEFDVGCDCVMKANKAAGKAADPAMKEIRKIKAKASKAREAARIATLVEELQTDELRTLLASKKHPVAYRADQGETLLDSVEWYMANAGHAGKIKMVRLVAKVRKC